MVAIFLLLLFTATAPAQKFYPDDPVWNEPPPQQVDQARRRKLSDYYDLFLHTLYRPGEYHRKGQIYPARAVNTLGEVPDSAWYTNRHGRTRMPVGDLVRGAGNENAPSMEGPWQVLSAKSEGVTPGFFISDAAGRRYFLKFDPIGNPEMASAADVIGAKFFHALGYFVPQNYIVRFRRGQLEIGSKAKLRDDKGIERPMTPLDVTQILYKASADDEDYYRAVASFLLEGTPLGPFRYFGVRADDPNDVVPHEHRRDLRGLWVFCAWLNHEDSRSINTLDMLVDEGSRRYIRHHLIDFGSILGSASEKSNSARSSHERLFSFKPALTEIFTLGLWVPKWTRVRYPDLPSVGRFESSIFHPEEWRGENRNPAFENRLPGDTFWAARQVIRFTDEDIAAVVRTGEYSDPRAERWVIDRLIERRNKIGEVYFTRVLPLDNFAVRGGELAFDDLGAQYGFAQPREFQVTWSRFDNRTGETIALPGAASRRLPDAAADFLHAEIGGGDPLVKVLVYLRRNGAGWEPVGVERTWRNGR